MSSKAYHERWIAATEGINNALEYDAILQHLAENELGVKPHGEAVELIGRVYVQYCHVFSELCRCYDQVDQIQKRQYIKPLVDAVTCRIMELKEQLERIEVIPFTYPHNAMVQLLVCPQDVKLFCPAFYGYELRDEEMQYIVDQIMAGNRIGDPEPTPSEVERAEEERLELETRLREEQEAELKRKLLMGEEIIIEEPEVYVSPEEQELRRQVAEYNSHLYVIQTQEKTRQVIKAYVYKHNMDRAMYLELSGEKQPPKPEELQEKAIKFIQRMYRRYLELKREQLREDKLRTKLGMVEPSWKPPSVQNIVDKIEANRRVKRKEYVKLWMADNLKENTKILEFKKGKIMEDIGDEVREWFRMWYDEAGLFDEYPWPGEGGSVLVVSGLTFTIDEYHVWWKEEAKRLKENAENPKSKQQIKEEKKMAKEEKKRERMEQLEKEAKRLKEYKNSRMNPENDPGIRFPLAKTVEDVQNAYMDYHRTWKDLDRSDVRETIRGYLMDMVVESQYAAVNLELRPIVDEMMRLELVLLKAALKKDYLIQGKKTVPTSKKRKKPKVKKQKKEKIKQTPANMFQELVDEGIVRKYPQMQLDDFWGDCNYAAADLRAIEWTPKFPPPCLGDIREAVLTSCVFPLGSMCTNKARSVVLVGPPSSGKTCLANAICTETNAVMFDLSPMYISKRYPGPKNLGKLLTLVTKMSKMVQPSVIFIKDADKGFYKKVPKEEKVFDLGRLEGKLFSSIIKPLKPEDRVLVLGTASQPWVTKAKKFIKAYPVLIMIPRTDYGSLALILNNILMKYHGVHRDFNVHSLAQVLRGYDLKTVREAISQLLNAERIAQLGHRPLQPVEVLDAVLKTGVQPVTKDDYQQYTDFFNKNTSWGKNFEEYQVMLAAQLEAKEKMDKKKKKPKK